MKNNLPKIKIKITPSWIQVIPDNVKKVNLPYRVARTKNYYKIPNTLLNYVHLSNYNSIENPRKTQIAWKKHFVEHDNHNLLALMEKLKTNEQKGLIHINKKVGSELWSFLYNHQKITAYLSLVNNSYGLFLDMGAGKTIAALQVAYIRLARRQTDRVLIVAPANVMTVWTDEIQRLEQEYNITGFDYQLLVGSKAQRIEILKKTNNKVYIINYEMVATLEKEIREKNFNMFILDESARVKDPSTQVTKSLTTIAEGIRYKLLLTGTPIKNTSLDIQPQMNILQNSGIYQPFPENYYAFRASYFRQKYKKKFAPWVLDKENDVKVNKLIYSTAIRYESDECTTLPKLVKQNIEFEMSPEMVTYYDSIKENIITTIKGKEVKTKIALTKIMKLAQITSGFISDSKGTNIRLNKSPKLDIIEELISETKEKVVIFCKFRETILMLKERIGKEAVLYYGGMTHAQKERAKEEFKNNPKKRIFISQIKSGGVGLNLQKTSHYTIFCELDYSSADYDQAVKRTHRNGQEHKCIVINIICKNSIDVHLLDIINSKRSSAAQILRTVIRKLEKEPRRKK